MAKADNKSLKSILSFFLVFVIVLLVANNSVFLHAHKLPDGRVIIHAHPFDKESDNTPVKSHHHSKPAIFFLENLQILFFFFLATVLLSNLKTKCFVFFIKERIIYEKLFSLSRNRAPPLI